MSTENDVARSLRSWLTENRHEDADRVLDVVFDQVPATPQRSASWLTRRFPIMNNNLVRFGVSAVVAALALIVVLNVLPRLDVGPAPTPSPSATEAHVLPTTLGASLSPGTYSLSNFPVGITLEVGARWHACSESDFEQAVCYYPTEADTAGQLAFLIVTNVVTDPCDPTSALVDPPVGPSVDDLVTAISNLEGFEATSPMDTNLDGFRGKQFTLTAPTTSGCEGFGTWATKFRTTGMGPGETDVVRIIDVNGVRVLIAQAWDPAGPAAAVFEGVLASVQIQP